MSTPTDETQVSSRKAGEEEGEPPVQSVVWGEARDFTDRRVITYRIGEKAFRIRKVGEGIVQVQELNSEDPPFLASSGSAEGALRMGHTRRTRPMILRFPRPVRLFPGTKFECYSSYPTQPGLFYEVPDKEPVHLVDLPALELQKTHYGDIRAGSICDLHMTEHRDAPDKIPDDPQLAAVRIRVKNRSDKPLNAGILLVYPTMIDFYVKDNRLSLNTIEFILYSDQEGDIRHLDKPSIEDATLVEKRLEEETGGKAVELFRAMLGERTMQTGF